MSFFFKQISTNYFFFQECACLKRVFIMITSRVHLWVCDGGKFVLTDCVSRPLVRERHHSDQYSAVPRSSLSEHHLPVMSVWHGAFYIFIHCPLSMIIISSTSNLFLSLIITWHFSQHPPLSVTNSLSLSTDEVPLS